MRIRQIAIIILIILLMIQPLFAGSAQIGTTAMDFLKISKSVKAESLGNAVTAGQNLDGVGINPASIAACTQMEINFHSLNYLEDMVYHNFNLVVPTEMGRFGLNLGYLDYGRELRTTLSDRAGASNETFGNVSYEIMGVYSNSYDKLNFGVGIKYIEQNLDNIKAQAIGADLGATYQLNKEISLGLAFNNITLKKAKFITDSADLPLSLRAGVMYFTAFFNQPLTLSLDGVVPSDDDAYFALGAEYSISNILNFRTGYSNYGELGDFSLGLGLVLDNINIDFTYKPYKEFGSSSRIGIGIKL